METEGPAIPGQMIPEPSRRPGELHHVDKDEILRRATRRTVYGMVSSAALVGAVLPFAMGLPWAFSFAIPASMLVLMVAIGKPQVAILAVLAARTLIDVLWWTTGTVFGVNLTQFASGAIVAVVALIVLLRPPIYLNHRLVIAFTIFGFFSTISIMVASKDLFGMLNGLSRIVGTGALCVLATMFFRDAGSAKRVMWVLTLSGLLANVVGLYYYFTNQGMIDLDNLTRAFGAYSNLHNTAHATAAFAAFGGFWLYTRGFDRVGIFGGVICALSIASLYLTLVRTPMVGVAVVYFVFVLVERRYWLAGAGAGAVAVVLAYNATMRARFDVFLVLLNTGELSDGAGSGRWGLWKEVLYNYSQRPFFELVFGVGGGHQLDLNLMGWDTYNDYLGMLVQSGPASLVAHLWAQGVLFVVSLRLARNTDDLWVKHFAHFMVAYNAGVTVMNFISNSYGARIQVQWFFWTLAGVVLGLYLGERQRLRQAVP